MLYCLLINLLLCQQLPIYWETLSKDERKELVRSEKVNQSAVKYADGSVVLSDNDKTFELIDELTRKQEDPRVQAFYFHVFNEFLKKADGALAEPLESYVFEYFSRNPVYVLGYLESRPEWESVYVDYLATHYCYSEYYDEDQEVYKSTFKQDLADLKSRIPKQKHAYLDSFYRKIIDKWQEM